MAHEIANIIGKDAVWTARKPAWHGLGITTAGAKAWKEAMEIASINFTVSKKQLEFAGKPVDAWGIFNDLTGKFYGAVGSQYTPIQNHEMGTLMDALVEVQDGVHYETAGALGSGERVWALLSIPFSFRIDGTDDEHKTYLLGSNRHDGKEVNRYKLTSVRVVCANTMAMALRGTTENELRIRHTPNFQARLDEARKVLIGVHSEVKTLQDKLNFLNKKQMKPSNWRDVLGKMFPKMFPDETGKFSVTAANQARDVVSLFERNDGTGGFSKERGTALNAYNAITEYVDHFRGTNQIEQVIVETKRAETAIFGNGDTLKNNALDWILSSVDFSSGKETSTVDSILANMAI